MREIKFRGKRIDNGEWVIGSLVKATEHYAIVIYKTTAYEDAIKHEPVYYEIDPETVGQYAGAHNWYEGDLFKTNTGAIREIVWDDYFCAFKFQDVEAIDGVRSMFPVCELSGVTKIGNIHDKED